MVLPSSVTITWRASALLVLAVAVTAAQKPNSGGYGRGDRGWDWAGAAAGGSSRHHRRDRIICSEGTYLNRTTRECLDCSTCPLNQIIRRPCNIHRDTVCGPFYEFQNFHHGASILQSTLPQRDSPAGERPVADGADPAAQLSTEAGLRLDGRRGDGRAADGSGGDKPQDFTDTHYADGHTKDPTMQSSAERWRELCFGLIGALATVTFLALIYVIITQISARRQARKHAADIECRTVLYPTTRVFANGFLSTTDYQKITTHFKKRGPYHWLLRHLRGGPHKAGTQNHYVVTDGGDVAMPLHVIPESVEMDHIQGEPDHDAQVAGGDPYWPSGSTQSTDSGIST